MPELSQEQQQAIIAALERAEARAPCPRCGNASFTLLGGYFVHHLQFGGADFSFVNPSVPTAVVACNRCGFLAQHALGALGLLPPSQPPSEGKAK